MAQKLDINVGLEGRVQRIERLSIKVDGRVQRFGAKGVKAGHEGCKGRT